MTVRHTKRARRYPSIDYLAKKRPLSKDYLELVIQLALNKAGIPYYMGSEPFAECKHLDFYIPHLDTHIECKHRYTERTQRQLERACCVIYIQDLRACLAFVALMQVEAEPIINMAIARLSIAKVRHDELLEWNKKRLAFEGIIR